MDWQALLVYLAPPEKIGTKPELKEQQSVTNRMGDARAYKKKKNHTIDLGARKDRWSQLSSKETILQYAKTKVSKAKLIPFL